ncbi:MAG: radical SAM family heme chaperone HemW [Polyangiaceae bacterium]
MRGSVYVHFPWCLAKCPYCDFVSFKAAPDAIDHEGYADAVVHELAFRKDAFVGALGARGEPQVASVFFGGGTPSLWEPGALGRVLAGIRASLPVTSDLEVTVECNPTSLDEAKARALADEGVNRLSIGTQSLDAKSLSFLGRLHDPQGAVAAITAAKRVPDLRVSTDLIFGLPDQAPETARAEAVALAELGLTHLSCYQLTIEPGTQFGELARRGRLPLADDGRVAEGFLAIDEALGERGFRHYEISNYAHPGAESRHNLGYWRGESYLGLGCAAYGAFGGARLRNSPDPARYVAWTRTLHAADAKDEATREPLDGETLLRERIMLGLRLEEGFDLEAAADELGVTPWTDERRRAAAWLASRDRLVVDGPRLRIPRAAWLFTDDTAARLF